MIGATASVYGLMIDKARGLLVRVDHAEAIAIADEHF